MRALRSVRVGRVSCIGTSAVIQLYERGTATSYRQAFRETVCQPDRLGQAVRWRQAQHPLGGAFEADPVTHGNIEGLHAVFRSDDEADALAAVDQIAHQTPL